MAFTGEQRAQAGEGDGAGAAPGEVVAFRAPTERIDQPQQARLLAGREVRHGRVKIDEGPEARRQRALEGVGQPAPATAVGNALLGESPQETGGVAGFDRRLVAPGQQPPVEDRQRRTDVARVDVEHGEMPGVVSAHAAVGVPLPALLAHPLRAALRPAGIGDRVRHGVHRHRAEGIVRQGFPAQGFGARGVAALRVGERRHGEQRGIARVLLGPRGHAPREHRAHALVPPEEEIARLHQPQREQVARPTLEDCGIALRGEHRIAVEPGLSRGEVRSGARGSAGTYARVQHSEERG